ncbi:MAG: MTH938/NDUFAF3 family protein [Pseudomonadota bacterium]
MSDAPPDASGSAPARGQATVMREAHYPDRAPVEAYGNGGFRFAGMSHRGAIMCLPSGIYGWSPETASELFDVSLFDRAVSEGDELELLLVGTGDDLVPLTTEVRKHLTDAGVRTEVMSTGAAIRTFNVLLGEGRRVGTALLPVG